MRCPLRFLGLVRLGTTRLFLLRIWPPHPPPQRPPFPRIACRAPWPRIQRLRDSSGLCPRVVVVGCVPWQMKYRGVKTYGFVSRRAAGRQGSAPTARPTVVRFHGAPTGPRRA